MVPSYGHDEKNNTNLQHALLSIRSYNSNGTAKKNYVNKFHKSVIPPWQTDHKPTGELELHEYRKNLINPHEDVLNGTYELPMPDLKTGHWNNHDKQRLQRPGTTASSNTNDNYNYASSRYTFTNDAYKQLRSSFHPRKKSNWFDD